MVLGYENVWEFMYWYLKNCVWFIKFYDKFEKL